MSTEHIFPKSIGGTLTLRELCKPCNDYLGRTCDSKLVNHQYVQFSRRQFGLVEKSGKEPLPLGRGSVAGRPSQKILWKSDGEIQRLPWMETTPDGETIVVGDAGDQRLSEIAGTIRERRAPDTPVRIRTMPKNAGAFEFELRFHDPGYKFGIIKIVYELAYKILGPRYLNDPVGVQLRDVLRDLEPTSPDDNLARIVGAFGGLYDGPMMPVVGAPPSALVGVVHAAARPGVVHAYVRVFDRFDARFLVSNDAAAYELPADGCGWIIDVVEGMTRPTTLTRLRGA